jgi:hypothetical protein
MSYHMHWAFREKKEKRKKRQCACNIMYPRPRSDCARRQAPRRMATVAVPVRVPRTLRPWTLHPYLSLPPAASARRAGDLGERGTGGGHTARCVTVIYHMHLHHGHQAGHAGRAVSAAPRVNHIPNCKRAACLEPAWTCHPVGAAPCLGRGDASASNIDHCAGILTLYEWTCAPAPFPLLVLTHLHVIFPGNSPAGALRRPLRRGGGLFIACAAWTG